MYVALHASISLMFMLTSCELWVDMLHNVFEIYNQVCIFDLLLCEEKMNCKVFNPAKFNSSVKFIGLSDNIDDLCDL